MIDISNIQNFSNKYKVIKLSKDNINEIYDLCIYNTLYYQYCPPLVTKESIIEDMYALPPNKTIKDKYYIGFYKNNKLIAIMDLINNYPNNQIIFIGFFMSDISIQNKGISSEIINYLSNYLANQNYLEIQLAWIKGNKQASHFWIKNNFKAVKETTSNDGHTVILATRKL